MEKPSRPHPACTELTDNLEPIKPDLKDNIFSLCLLSLALMLLWVLLYGC